MNRQKLFSEINYAMNSIAYNEQETKEWKKALKKVKEDLEEYKMMKKEMELTSKVFLEFYDMFLDLRDGVKNKKRVQSLRETPNPLYEITFTLSKERLDNLEDILKNV